MYVFASILYVFNSEMLHFMFSKNNSYWVIRIFLRLRFSIVWEAGDGHIFHFVNQNLSTVKEDNHDTDNFWARSKLDWNVIGRIFSMIFILNGIS